MVIIGLVGRIFQFQAFMADVPQVAVAAVAGIRGERKVDAVGLAVGDFGFPGIQGPLIVSPCGDNLDVGSQRLDAKLETDLVVALAGSAVADGDSAFFAGNLHQLFGDQGAGHGSAQQVFVFVNSVGLYAGNDIIVAEFIHHVQNIQLGSAAELRPLFQAVQFFFLSAVDADTDDLIIEVFLQPGDNGGSIQSAGISQNYFFFHFKIVLPIGFKI